MPSQLDSAIQRARRLMAEEDATARSRMVAIYADAIDGIEIALARLAEIPVEEMTYSQLVADYRYRLLLAEAEVVFHDFADDAQEVLLRAQRRAVGAAQRTVVPLMRAAAPDILSARFVRLPEADLQEFVGTLGPGSPVRTVLERYGVRAAETIESEFILGISQGTNSRVITRRIMDQVGGESWRVEMLARTETQRPFRSSLIKTYQMHGHLLDGWKWSAAKSTRTCLACLSLDGDVFPLSVSFMGNHPNCRCSPTPYRKAANIQSVSGEQWFLSQPERTQRKMLPAGAWEPFQSGVLRLEDFVQRDNDPVWGITYRPSGLHAAMARAERRQIRRVA